MKLDNVFQCDGCTNNNLTYKNGWYVVRDNTFTPSFSKEIVDGVSIVSFFKDYVSDQFDKHACGIECALKLASKALVKESV